MADFLTRLAERTLGVIPVAQPMIDSLFAPGPTMNSTMPKAESWSPVDETNAALTLTSVVPTRGATTFQNVSQYISEDANQQVQDSRGRHTEDLPEGRRAEEQSSRVTSSHPSATPGFLPHVNPGSIPTGVSSARAFPLVSQEPYRDTPQDSLQEVNEQQDRWSRRTEGRQAAPVAEEQSSRVTSSHPSATPGFLPHVNPGSIPTGVSSARAFPLVSQEPYRDTPQDSLQEVNEQQDRWGRHTEDLPGGRQAAPVAEEQSSRVTSSHPSATPGFLPHVNPGSIPTGVSSARAFPLVSQEPYRDTPQDSLQEINEQQDRWGRHTEDLPGGRQAAPVAEEQSSRVTSSHPSATPGFPPHVNPGSIPTGVSSARAFPLVSQEPYRDTPQDSLQEVNEQQDRWGRHTEDLPEGRQAAPVAEEQSSRVTSSHPSATPGFLPHVNPGSIPTGVSSARAFPLVSQEPYRDTPQDSLQEVNEQQDCRDELSKESSGVLPWSTHHVREQHSPHATSPQIGATQGLPPHVTSILSPMGVSPAGAFPFSLAEIAAEHPRTGRSMLRSEKNVDNQNIEESVKDASDVITIHELTKDHRSIVGVPLVDTLGLPAEEHLLLPDVQQQETSHPQQTEQAPIEAHAPSPVSTPSSRNRPQASSPLERSNQSIVQVPLAGAPRPAAQAGPTTPTVHVTIGRIEVRATPPPPSKPSRRSPTLSLDDYLKQHRGGGL